jgi:hypothetical protein
MYRDVLATEIKGNVDLHIARYRPYGSEILIFDELGTRNIAVYSLRNGPTADVN